MNLTLTNSEAAQLINAKRERAKREAMARESALYRFRTQQQQAAWRKREKRITAFLWSVTALLATGFYCFIGTAFAEFGAKQGPILAKSEMTKAQVKALNIIQPVREKAHDKAKH